MNNAVARIRVAAIRIFAETGSTSIAVSELAREAGLARGTIYNNIDDPAQLFPSLCDAMAAELTEVMRSSFGSTDDPAQRLADIVRLCIRRVHDEPDWGRFVARFAMAAPQLGAFWAGLPAEELRRGIAAGRFSLERSQVGAIAAAAGGATFGAFALVLNGYRTWRDCGSDTAEFVLRGIGLDRTEARRLADSELAHLPPIGLHLAA